MQTRIIRVSVQGVKSLGSYLHVYAGGLIFYEVKKNIIFQKEKGNTFILLIVKSLQKGHIHSRNLLL